MKYLIVGLGNVGSEYEGTRHNCGFMVVDALARQAGVSWRLERHAYRCELRHKGRTLVLIKPTTYMNLSGKAVNYWMQQEHVEMDHLLVVVDDLALPIGALRIKRQGSGGGHNGLADIEAVLHTSAYARLRIGIGADFGRGHQIDYVLGVFSAEEQEQLEPVIERATTAVLSLVTIGPDRTMNIFNTNPKATKEAKEETARTETDT